MVVPVFLTVAWKLLPGACRSRAERQLHTGRGHDHRAAGASGDSRVGCQTGGDGEGIVAGRNAGRRRSAKGRRRGSCSRRAARRLSSRRSVAVTPEGRPETARENVSSQLPVLVSWRTYWAEVPCPAVA